MEGRGACCARTCACDAHSHAHGSPRRARLTGRQRRAARGSAGGEDGVAPRLTAGRAPTPTQSDGSHGEAGTAPRPRGWGSRRRSPAAGPAALTPQARRVPPGARATTAHASPCSPEVRPPPGTEQAPGPHPPRPTQASGPVRGHRDVHGAPLENQLRESAGTSRVVTSAPRPHGAAAA